jgi:hypothetical protein
VARDEQERRDPHQVPYLGQSAVGKMLGGHLGEDVVLRRRTPVGDVRGEPLIQVRQGIHVHRAVLVALNPTRILRGAIAGQQFTEHRMVGLGHTE